MLSYIEVGLIIEVVVLTVMIKTGRLKIKKNGGIKKNDKVIGL